jgi:hypothetical protein
LQQLVELAHRDDRGGRGDQHLLLSGDAHDFPALGTRLVELRHDVALGIDYSVLETTPY